MAEAMSPSSSRSNDSSPPDASTPKSRPGNGAVSLVVQKQPPTHVFPDEWFEVEFGLDSAKGKGGKRRTTRAAGDSDTEFVATLHHSKSGRLATSEEATLEMEPQSIRLSLKDSPTSRKQRTRCCIRMAQPPGKSSNATYVIRLSPMEESGATALRGIKPVTTTSLAMVNHKVRVTPEEWDEIWYKDEGGRDKCMTVDVSLYDKNNELYTGEQVPLEMTLYYDNGVDQQQAMKVMKQEFLRTMGSTKMYIDKKTGKATLRFRIEDVSKNHQGQDFRVQIAPDSKVKGYKDVAPGYTPAVSIRSKRNKRQRSAGRGDPAFPSPGRMRQLTPKSAYSGRGGDGVDSPLNASDLPRLREAVKGVMQWTDEVMNGLYQMQWQVIGYAQNPDGSQDFSRPYHNMVNPNAHIARLLSMYSDSTRDHLSTLRMITERAGGEGYNVPSAAAALAGGGGQAGMGSPFGASMPHSLAQDYATSGMALQGAMQQQYQLMGRSSYNPAAAAALPAQQGAAQQMRASPVTVPAAATQAGGDIREGEVAYVLAKHFKALRTGERLGFPAFSANKEILGFYRESSTKVGVNNFVPISDHSKDFGPLELMQASEILVDAIEKKSEAVHVLKDWGSISNLLDHAMVYDWSRNEMASGTNDSSGGSGNSGGGAS